MPKQSHKRSRKSARNILIDSNVRVSRIYPIEDTKKRIENLQTVGLKLSREQAIHLARVLLAATQDWETIELTGYRFDPRDKDGTYRLTVTSMQKRTTKKR